MVQNSYLRLDVNTYGNLLGAEKGCIRLRDKNGKVKLFPLHEKILGEINVKSGNVISTALLCSLAYWNIDLMISTRNGKPLAVFRNIDDDSHVEVRISQYRALSNGKGYNIAKQLVKGKIEGQNYLLEKYGYNTHTTILDKVIAAEAPNLKKLRPTLLSLEGIYSRYYFKQIFKELPESIRPETRSTFKAYTGVNNVLNLCYRILFSRCYQSLVKNHMEPYLGYLHSTVVGRPSFVYDFMEVYRHLIDYFVIEYCRDLSPHDFTACKEMIGNKMAKRIFLTDEMTDDCISKLSKYFDRTFPVPNKKGGKKAKLSTIITDEPYSLWVYFQRTDKYEWVPKIPHF